MKSGFDMALFLNPVLKGAHTTRQRLRSLTPSSM